MIDWQSGRALTLVFMNIFYSLTGGGKGCLSSDISICADTVWCHVLPVGWAVGSLAGATHRGRRKESQSEHHRAVIPLDDETRRRAARPDSDSDNILRSHAVQQKGGRWRHEKLSNDSPPLTWKTNQHDEGSIESEQQRGAWMFTGDLKKVQHAIRKKFNKLKCEK